MILPATVEGVRDHFPALQIVVPMLSAPLCIFLRRPRATWALAVAVTWTSFFMSVAVLIRVLASGVISYHVGNWAPPLGIELRIDGLNAFVMLIVTGVSAIVVTAAPRSLEKDVPRSRHHLFFCAYLLCMTGLAGMTATGDAFNIFVFLEISSLSSYVLISQGPAPRALTSAFRYLVMGTFGGTFLLLGIGLLYMKTGTLNIVDLSRMLQEAGPDRTVLAGVACITVGVGIKLALFPLHIWLPNAYAYAPAVVTAFLAATATKVAYYVLVRFLFSVFGAGLAFGRLHLELALMPMALAAMFVASTVAIFQKDVKRMLAYSSVAQVGYMVLGLSFHSVNGLTGGIVHLFNHALMKAGLFLLLAVVALRLGSTRIEQLRGLGRRAPLTMAAFVLGGLSLIGVPLTVGFVSKWYLVLAALETGNWPVAAGVLLSSLLAVAYIWRVVEVAYFQAPPEGARRLKEPLSLVLPAWILMLACVYFGVFTSQTAALAGKAATMLIGGS